MTSSRVDPATARLLAGSDGLSAVCVHLPLSAEARDELANFDDVALDGEARREAGGWFSAAVFEGEGLTRVVGAVLEEADEAIESPLLEAALGRGPSDGFSPPPRRRSTRTPVASRTTGVAEQDEDDDYDF